MIKTKTLGICIFILLISGCSFTGNTVKQENYKIAVITPLTGDGSNLGQPFASGMKLAVDEINSNGGINGKKIELFVEDSKLSGRESLNAVNYLETAVDPDVYSVIFAAPALSVSSYLQDAKKPLIYEAFSREVLNNNPYAFKANFDSEDGCKRLAEYLKENGKYRKLGVIFAKAPYSEECLIGIKKIEPNVSEYWYTFGETDFRTILEKSKKDGVDRIVIQGIEFEFVALFRQLTEGNYNIKVACATTSECITSNVKESASEQVLNGTISIDFIPQEIEKGEFAKKYLQKYPDAGFAEIAYGAVGYEEIMYISKAMENCRPGDSSCMVNSLGDVSNYNSIILSKGFKDRILQLSTDIYNYNGNEWVIS